MKSAHVTLLIIICMFVFFLSGCKARETASNTAASATPSPSTNANTTDNSNQAVQTGGSNRNAGPTSQSSGSDSAKAKATPQLIGTYESREVHSGGVVTVISKLRTTWLFSSDGKYSRVSEVNGKMYHGDSGIFRIEAPDKLVLTIQVTGVKNKRKPQIPAVEKAHKYTLSPDGDELRLISEKGSVGVFQRVAKPNGS